MNYTKGDIHGGWIRVLNGKTPIALVHPGYVDKFLAAPDMYKALKSLLWDLKQGAIPNDLSFIKEALAKAAKSGGLPCQR